MRFVLYQLPVWEEAGAQIDGKSQFARRACRNRKTHVVLSPARLYN